MFSTTELLTTPEGFFESELSSGKKNKKQKSLRVKGMETDLSDIMLSLSDLDDLYNARFVEISGRSMEIRPSDRNSLDQVKYEHRTVFVRKK